MTVEQWQRDSADTADPITRLVNAFRKLPGVGERTATRLAFFVLNEPEEVSRELADALVDVKERVGLCEECCNLTNHSRCAICSDPRRDSSLICVVERTQDLRAIERTGDYRGRYHVLHGLISPLDGVGPDDIYVRKLVTRLQNCSADLEVQQLQKPSADLEVQQLQKPSADVEVQQLQKPSADLDVPRLPVEEVIVATSPSVDGEATALYLQRLLDPIGIRVSRIASGVPIGGDLEYTDRVTLARALEQRREM